MLDFVDWSQWTYNELATHLFNLGTLECDRRGM